MNLGEYFLVTAEFSYYRNQVLRLLAFLSEVSIPKKQWLALERGSGI